MTVGFKDAMLNNLPNLPVYRLHRLEMEYPPRDHIVIENPAFRIPPPPKKVDRTCGYTSLYHVLDEQQLTHTVDTCESGIFLNAETDEVVAVVIRDLAKDYFPVIQPWSVDLVENSVNRRHLCLRNNPGKLARVGVSPGPRHARLFGWVRNLRGRHRKENNETKQHDINISSLFGFFYALVRARVPTLTDAYKAVMK